MTETEKKIEINEKTPDTEKDTLKEKSLQKESPRKLTLHRPYHFPMMSSIGRMFNEMNRWFDDFFWRPGHLWDERPFSLDIFEDEPLFRTPLANITDEGDHFKLTAELPGLEKGDLEITVHDGALEIKGEKKNEFEEKDRGYLRREYNSLNYYILS